MLEVPEVEEPLEVDVPLDPIARQVPFEADGKVGLLFKRLVYRIPSDPITISPKAYVLDGSHAPIPEVPEVPENPEVPEIPEVPAKLGPANVCA